MIFRFLSKYFPSPVYLEPPHVGLSFADDSIKALYFDKSTPKSSLSSAIMPLEKGAIIEGKIVNREEVVKKLKEIRSHFDTPFVFFAIPDELVYVFQASVPVGKKESLAESVSFIMEENIPLSASEAIFDFMPIAISSTPKTEVSLVVSACLQKEIENLLKVLRESGFEPVGGVHESQAIAQAIIPKGSKKISCIIHARSRRVGIYLAEGNIVQFATLRPITGEDYEKEFLDEHEKFLDYALKHSSEDAKTMDAVLICGDFEYAKRIAEAIVASGYVTKEVKLANVWSNVFEIDKDVPDIKFETSLNLAGPIGAVLSEIA